MAIDLNPLDAKTFINKGILLIYSIGILHKEMGNKAQALMDYNKSIELDSTNELAYINRGNNSLYMSRNFV